MTRSALILKQPTAPESLKFVSAIFSLFLKEQCVSWLFQMKYFEKEFNLQQFQEHLFYLELPRATHLLKTSCFEKITVCVIQTIIVTLPLVQINKARRNVSQQIKHKSR